MDDEKSRSNYYRVAIIDQLPRERLRYKRCARVKSRFSFAPIIIKIILVNHYLCPSPVH